MQTCNHCLKILPLNQFYKNGNKLWNYCKPCESKRKKQQLVNFKKQCLKYKNQYSCELCGYNKCLVALDFHHKDPKQKIFNISKCKCLKLNNKIKSELDKCQVICSNCHRELHALESTTFTPKILNPRSPCYCLMCGIKCSYGAQRCFNCNKKKQSSESKIPSKENLISDIKKYKTKKDILDKYQISSYSTLRKWFKKYDLKYE